jgi:hypothetical protein
MKRIDVTTTAYEGDVAFPEADHYPEYVVEQLANRYAAVVMCSLGRVVRVSADGFGDDDYGNNEVEGEVTRLVKVDLWDDFCAEGYKAFAVTGGGL